ncbi:hypothetical protein CcI6DRAFT_03679 [Frankia sp. CcI6]|nr:hypothetical protein CcI6DRAFT_03679 [Frankia sp. CcI6]OAA19646.1 Fatty acid desaturase [Frankia casuarinae]
MTVSNTVTSATSAQEAGQRRPARSDRSFARPVLPPLLPASDLAAAVTAFHSAGSAARRWDVESAFRWDEAEADRLTEGQRSAVRFITLIEDHLPGYFDLYERAFPLNSDVDLETFIHNRELYHFTVRWAQEEDSHARALFRYQVAAGIAEPEELRRELAAEGRKKFDLPLDHAVSLFAYALVQEKATQLYYQQLQILNGRGLFDHIRSVRV